MKKKVKEREERSTETVRIVRTLRIPILVVLFLAILTGCLREEQRMSMTGTEALAPEPVQSSADSPFTGEAEERYTLEQVEEALQNQGIPLASKHLSPDWVLSGVQAMTYTLEENQPEGSGSGEWISVYVFDTEEARAQGWADFQKQKERYDMQVPNEHPFANVLILYWHRESVDRAPAAVYEQDITAALDHLSEASK